MAEELAPAVFFDTGGGDIYAGRSREDVIAAMRADLGDDFAEDAMEEVSGDAKISVTDENEDPTGELITLAEEYGSDTDAHMVSSSNL